MLYNSGGQLVCVTDGPYLSTLYSYNEMGERTLTCLDLNGNFSIDDFVDRVSCADSYYEKDGAGDWWRVLATSVHDNTGLNTVFTNNIQKTRLTGLSTNLTSEVVAIGPLGTQSVSRTSVNRETKQSVSRTSFAGSVVEAVTETVNGLTTATRSQAGVETTYGYDPLGRQVEVVDARTGPCRTHYNDKGQVDWTEDAASNRTAFAYAPATGRQVAVSNALGQVTRSEYDAEGRLLGTWGATYPDFYAYDGQGRMTDMFTLRGPDVEALVTNHASFLANIASFDRTTWLYDEATGLLTNKVYADGRGTAYTYDWHGRISTRTWARGVVTTYSYDDMFGGGALTHIGYSDSTPGVSFAYDGLGRLTNAAVAGVLTCDYLYDPASSVLTNEVVSLAALPAARSIARFHDSLLRPTGFSLDNGQATAYEYDGTGRLSAVAWSVGGSSSTARYAYVEHSGMVAGYDIERGGGTFRTRKTFEPFRDLIASVSNAFVSSTGTLAVSSFDYLNDALGRPAGWIMLP